MKRAILILVLILPVTSWAFCMPPIFNEPIIQIRIKPSKPFCAASQSCSQWDADRYNQEIDDYVVFLKRYVREAQDAAALYSDAAVAYAKCQIQSN